VIPAPEIPGHTVTGVLGSGGFATVYRTWQVAVGRETAVKVDSRVLHTERDRRRFFREVTAAGRLSGHPHVIDVYDAGTLRDGRPYLVMELCPDGSLNDELRRSGPMNAALACRIGASLADALAAAHAAGILHRDIKPANILINRYGVVGLSDFGLASIIASSGEQSVSREALTPAYAPPESFEAAEPTMAADVYSLAATLYALMAGRPPRFPADSSSPGVAAILALHSQPVEDIPGVPPRMLDILRRCLETDPARRLPGAAALRDELAGLLEQPDGGPVSAAAPPVSAAPAPYPVPRPSGPPPGYEIPSTAPISHAEIGGRSMASTFPPAWSTTGPPTGPVVEPTPSGLPGRRGTHAAASSRRWRPMALAATAGGLVLIVVTALIIGAHLLAPGGSTAANGPSGSPGALGAFGIATTTSNCPAAAVPRAGARCPASPECWNGLVENVGIVTASTLPCDGPHSWQTFAIGIMPSDAAGFNVNIVQANPTVRAVCSNAVLLRSRVGQARLIPRSRWAIQVVPPDETAYNSGVRTYRCLASLGYQASKASQFGPGS
jgi:serine/threonine protein kinase